MIRLRVFMQIYIFMNTIAEMKVKQRYVLFVEQLKIFIIRNILNCKEYFALAICYILGIVGIFAFLNFP